MKKFYFLIALLFFNCSEKKINNSEINNYLKLVHNDSLNYKTRLFYNQKAFELLKGKNDSLSRDQLTDVIYNYELFKKNERFFISTNLLLGKSITSKDTLNIAFAYYCLAKYYNIQLINDKAYECFFKAIKLYKQSKCNRMLIYTYLDLSIFQYDIGDFDSSEKNVFKAINILKRQKHDNYKTWYRAYEILGMLHCDIKDFETSIKYHNKALESISNKVTDSKALFKEISLNNIGYAYQQNKKYKQSIIYFQEALKKDFTYDSIFYATVQDNLAYSKFKTKNFSQLPEAFFKALQIRNSVKFVPGIISSNLHLSEYFAYRKDTLKSIIYAITAYKFSKKNKLPLETLLSLKELLKVNREKCVQYSLDYIKISDSLQMAERKNRNKYARIAFETEEITTEKEEAIKQKWIILGSAGGILLFCILMFIIKIQRARQKELLLLQDQQKSDQSIYQLIQDQQVKIDEGRQAEKKRIAQELHDGVMNKLTSTRLNLFILNKKKDDETIRKCINFIDNIQDIEKEIRQVAHDLSDDIFSGNKSFNLLLEGLFNEQKSITPAIIHVQIDDSINWETVSSALKMNIYRILQEALQNASKYAQAKNIYITITRESELLHLIFQDDGIGFNPGKVKKGIGLKNMRQRVNALSGSINILSNPGQGTTVKISLPLNKIE